jgi:hypothetical protein
MQDQFLDDLETELDISVDSAASWLESFVERADIDEDDYETIQTIIANLYDCSDFIRAELGIGGEEEDYEEDDEDEYDPHLPAFLDDEDEEENDVATFVGTWDSIHFLEDDNGEVVGIRVDFA